MSEHGLASEHHLSGRDAEGNKHGRAAKSFLLLRLIALVGLVLFLFSIFETAKDVPSFYVSSAVFMILNSVFLYLVLFKNQMPVPLVATRALWPGIWRVRVRPWWEDNRTTQDGRCSWSTIDLMLVLQAAQERRHLRVGGLHSGVSSRQSQPRTASVLGFLRCQVLACRCTRRDVLRGQPLACDTLPCPVSFPPNNLAATSSVVFLMDYIIR